MPNYHRNSRGDLEIQSIHALTSLKSTCSLKFKNISTTNSRHELHQDGEVNPVVMETIVLDDVGMDDVLPEKVYLLSQCFHLLSCLLVLIND